VIGAVVMTPDPLTVPPVSRSAAQAVTPPVPPVPPMVAVAHDPEALGGGVVAGATPALMLPQLWDPPAKVPVLPPLLFAQVPATVAPSAETVPVAVVWSLDVNESVLPESVPVSAVVPMPTSGASMPLTVPDGETTTFQKPASPPPYVPQNTLAAVPLEAAA